LSRLELPLRGWAKRMNCGTAGGIGVV